MKPFIFCLGLPGNGKSTTSRVLERELEGYTRFNRNDMRLELGIPRYSFSQDTLPQKQQMKEFYEKLDERIALGEGLIVDKAGMIAQYRNSVYKWSKKFGVETLALYHHVPEQVAKQGISAREPRKDELGDYKFRNNDPRVYDLFKQQWEDPLLDLGNPNNSHVSMISWDYSAKVVRWHKVSRTIKPVAETIIDIMMRSSALVQSAPSQSLQASQAAHTNPA